MSRPGVSWEAVPDAFTGPGDPDWPADRGRLDGSLRDPWDLVAGRALTARPGKLAIGETDTMPMSFLAMDPGPTATSGTAPRPPPSSRSTTRQLPDPPSPTSLLAVLGLRTNEFRCRPIVAPMKLDYSP